MKIYLSGGFKSGWQEDVTKEILRMRPDAVVLDPYAIENRLPGVNLWMPANLRMISEADIIFAYMEVTNPAMSNLSFELGYAHSLNKKIILINEKGGKRAEMITFASDAHSDLQGALASLPMVQEFRNE